jgi:hypothetical protein
MRQCIDWEKIFSSHSTKKRLVFRIYKELKKLNIKQTNTTINEWVNELNTQFSEVQMTNKYMRKIFNMLGHTGQTYQYYTEVCLTPVTMSIIQKTKKNKCFRGCREKKPTYNVIGNVQQVSCIHFYWEFQQLQLSFGMSTRINHTLLSGI